jgi:hypothetical protein
MIDNVYSKYKIFGGFGLLDGLNLLMVFGIYKLLTASTISLHRVDLMYNGAARIAHRILFGILYLFLLLLMTQCKRIIADEDGITFINPLLPFLRKKNK